MRFSATIVLPSHIILFALKIKNARALTLTSRSDRDVSVLGEPENEDIDVNSAEFVGEDSADFGSEVWACGGRACKPHFNSSQAAVFREGYEHFWSCGEEPPWTAIDGQGTPENAHVTIILRGESFRSGISNHRYNGGGNTYTAQMNATRSQVELLIEPLVRKGFRVDVFSSTYTTQYTNDMLALLAPWLRNETRTEGGGSQGRNAWDAVYMAASWARDHQVPYHHIILLRHDLILKTDFSSQLLTDSQVLYPFHWYSDSTCHSHSRLPDLMQAMPGAFLGCMLDMLPWWPVEKLVRKLSGIIIEETAMDNKLQGALSAPIARVCSSSNTGHISNPLFATAMREDGPPGKPCK